MFNRKLTMALVVTLVSSMALYAKSKEEYIKELESQDDEVVVAAAQYLGKEEVTDAIDPLTNVAKTGRNSRIKIVAATALGQMDTKGKPTTNLKEIIETEADNNVVYASMLSILNLKDFKNPDAVKALEFCEANKQNDPYIKDIVEKVRQAMAK